MTARAPLHRETLVVATPGRGLHDVTGRVGEVVTRSGVDVGLCHLFLLHTSASLVVQENADPSVLRDLEAWMLRHVPDGTSRSEGAGRYEHDEEGPDDMPAHIRGMLTATSLTVPIEGGRLLLGTWQAIYLYEHRTRPYQRRLVVTAR